MNARIDIASLAAALALALFQPAPAGAACTFTALTNGVPVSAVSDPSLYTFTQGLPYWTAVAVRPGPTDDWDLAIGTSQAPEPQCVTSYVGISGLGAGVLDFVVGDFNTNPVGTYYVYASQYSGTGAAAVQWAAGAGQLYVDGAAVTQTLESNQMIRIYDVSLAAGFTYTFHFYPQSGHSAHVLLFRNLAGGVYWAGRDGAQIDQTSSFTYTAPVSGWYGVVVTSDVAGPQYNFTLGVSTSPCGIPTALNPGMPITVPSPSANVAFEAPELRWGGVAVRALSGDWDLKLYGSPTGTTAPVCFGNELATSQFSGNATDIVVGQFAPALHGWYYGRAYQFDGGAECRVQNTGNSGDLEVNGGTLLASLFPDHLATVREIWLDAGHTYAVTFDHTVPDFTLLVFENAAGGAYFAGRASAVLSTSVSTTYTPAASGYHALVVVNDGRAGGDYHLGVGECQPVLALQAGMPALGDSWNHYFSFTQSDPYWAAVAVRGMASDWDLQVSSDNVVEPAPVCATSVVATSELDLPEQDLVVGDFDWNPLGTYYVRAHQVSYAPLYYSEVEWDSGPDQLIPNDNNAPLCLTGPDDIVNCWDIRLEAGQTYRFSLAQLGGANLHLLVFHGPGGTYWAGRASAVLATTTTQDYTAPSTGYYGVVVVNDNAVQDQYSVNVSTCPPPEAIEAEPRLTPTLGMPVLIGSFTQATPWWTPVAVRANLASEDWDLALASTGTGGEPGICLSNFLSVSAFPGGATDYVIGNFNYVAGTYWIRAARYYGTGDATLQYHPGNQQLTPGMPHLVRTKSSDFLVEAWDAYMIQGETYTLFFSRTPGLNVKLDVFQATAGEFWGGRGNCMLETTRSASFVAPSSGWYGVVVVNDGGAGTFNLGFEFGVTAADGVTLPERDALRAIAPNPGRGGMRFDYALREPGTVTFEVLDLAGRRVSSLETGPRGAGTWSETWSATGPGGDRLPPGIYILRMRAGDRLVATRKVTLLQ